MSGMPVVPPSSGIPVVPISASSPSPRPKPPSPPPGLRPTRELSDSFVPMPRRSRRSRPPRPQSVDRAATGCYPVSTQLESPSQRVGRGPQAASPSAALADEGRCGCCRRPDAT
eukprot:1445362-Pyramimonas_sp.AAC.2